MKEIVLLKYGEIALKGANRASFESVLLKNIRRRLELLGKFSVTKAQSTITVEPLSDDVDMDEVFARLRRVFGVSALSRSVVVEKSLEAMQEGCRYLDETLAHVRSFKVEARRSDKRFALTSPEICRELGHTLLLRHPHLTVDVHNPEMVVMAEVRDNAAYIHAGQVEGAGGMPVGTAGRGVLLLSGGIDSPVAGHMMAKRGLALSAVHFASPPYTSERAKRKVLLLAKEMAKYTGRIPVDVVNFTEIQEEIAKLCPEEYSTLVMRRFMMEISSRIAQRQDAGALITGESLGQVASQTLQAIACTDAAADFVVMRPAIGLDKEEIIRIARKIGTFETSILPYEDCCTVFTPRHPRTRPQLAEVMAAEAKLDREALISRALEGVERLVISENSEV